MTPAPLRLTPRLTTIAASLAVAVTLAGCSGGGSSGDETARANKIADDLVKCKNDTSTLKDQIADLKTELAKLKAANDPTKHLDTVDATRPPEAPHHEGNLPPEAALKVLRAHAPSLRACYEKGLKRNPNLQYTTSVNVRFAVRNNGSAFDVNFSPRADAEMEHCMAQAIGKWPFPTFTGDPVQFEAPVSLVAK